MEQEARDRIRKLEKRFRKIKDEYLYCNRMLFLCKQDIKRMYNTEMIKKKQEKIKRLEKQIPALDEAGRKILAEPVFLQ